MKFKIIKGFKIELDLTENFGCSNDCGGKWAMVCVNHGFIIQDTNKARLWSHANNVADWCEIHNEVEAK